MTKIVVVRCDISGYEYSSNIHEQFHENFMNIVLKCSSNTHEQFHENVMNIVHEIFLNIHEQFHELL